MAFLAIKCCQRTKIGKVTNLAISLLKRWRICAPLVVKLLRMTAATSDDGGKIKCNGGQQMVDSGGGGSREQQQVTVVKAGSSLGSCLLREEYCTER